MFVTDPMIVNVKGPMEDQQRSENQKQMSANI